MKSNNNTNKAILLWYTCIMLMAPMLSYGQASTLTLAECYDLAEKNYPLTKQRELLAKTEEYTVENAAKGYLPQVSVNGQATYQSEVTQIPISAPGADIPTLNKDQYKIYAEVYQPLTDLKTVSLNKKSEEVKSAMDAQNLEVELYKLKERVNQLYFGILLIDEQISQTGILRSDIRSALDRTNSGIKNGMSLKSSGSELKAELLEVDQKIIELLANKKGYADMLALFIAMPLDSTVHLVKPQPLNNSFEIQRPELAVYKTQQESLLIQNDLISANNLPKFGLFFQGGFGSPSPVNMLSPDFSSYYLGGLKLTWNLTNFYTSSNKRQLLTIQSEVTDTQKHAFLFNTQLNLQQKDAEIEKLENFIASDDTIIELRQEVAHTAEVQLQNGAITVTDFLQQANAADKARQNKVLHEIQLLQAQYDFKTTSGN
ncbi:TolC family protein [Fulvivirga ligni]|uniref:TolC family protein n=1 Tax=Fulvivirga ligni TaxID=2904246 RepID=UPI001F2A2DAA|nr:TolC family protein [Fulvivirga ligni]UII21005.1 TolC family protein [Fulvivirga ligni]